MKRGIPLFLAAWAVVQTIRAATPVISAVAGTAATGQTQTISGSHLVCARTGLCGGGDALLSAGPCGLGVR